MKKSLILVSDRGCTCKKVVEPLLEQGQPFVLLLKKNRVQEEVYKGYSVAFFTFPKRRIGWRKKGYKVGKGEVRLLVFEDPILGGYQKNTYREQYAKRGGDIEELRKKEERTRKIALIPNTSLSPKEVFELYKLRQYIKEIVDRYRNHLLDEGIYMRNDERLQGWLRIVLHALQVHWFLLDRLRNADCSKDGV